MRASLARSYCKVDKEVGVDQKPYLYRIREERQELVDSCLKELLNGFNGRCWLGNRNCSERGKLVVAIRGLQHELPL